MAGKFDSVTNALRKSASEMRNTKTKLSSPVKNVARKGYRGDEGYHYDIPRNYLQQVDRRRIELDVKVGKMSLHEATKKEIARISTLVIHNTKTVKKKKTDKSGKRVEVIKNYPVEIKGEGYEFEKAVKDWNKEVGKLRKKYEKAGEKFPEGLVHEVKMSKVINPEKVMKAIYQKTPEAWILDRNALGIENLVRSLSSAGVPDSLIKAIEEKARGMSASELSRIIEKLANRPEPIDIFDSKQTTIKINIEIILEAFGIKVRDNNGDYTEIGKHALEYSEPAQYDD